MEEFDELNDNYKSWYKKEESSEVAQETNLELHEYINNMEKSDIEKALVGK